MSSQPSHRYTLEEYFALELGSEEKYEFWNGEVFCMSGASLAHNQIARNIGTELDTELRARGCQVFPADLRVKVPTHPPYRYPDLTALCGQPEIERVGGLDMLVNPALIVEVLSPSTEAFDRGDKFTYYKSIASFSEYILVAQHRPHVSQFVRQENGVWTFMEFNDLADSVRCASVPCVLALNEIYRDVVFEDAIRSKDQPEQTGTPDATL
ncbi:MAG TPA: Uma2 family endonuclease [Pyrinomonadaceae bacterium]|jgi:Uma2 family endonuclease|nr:Uma2 family endonuclease [Pyrinomonadaceae bacterium]